MSDQSSCFAGEHGDGDGGKFESDGDEAVHDGSGSERVGELPGRW